MAAAGLAAIPSLSQIELRENDVRTFAIKVHAFDEARRTLFVAHFVAVAAASAKFVSRNSTFSPSVRTFSTSMTRSVSSP